MQSHPELGELFLAFYECLSDPGQLDTLMSLLTSWLDDGDGLAHSLKLEYHADQAWRLLGAISEPAFQSVIETPTIQTTQFESRADVEAAMTDALQADDIAKLENWFSAEVAQEALLMRAAEDGATELVVLSRDSSGTGFTLKRTGPDYQELISQFVAENFALTHAEFTLVKELLLGGSLREISDRLGKSWETTRSQIKTLTNKLGVNSQTDLLRVTGQAAALMPVRKACNTVPQNAKSGKIMRPDGRAIVYEVDGTASEKTLVYLHGMTQGRHWPEKARDFAKEKGWRVVRISRAGRGASSINPKENEALLQDHVDDVIAIMNHEGISTFSIFGAADGFAVGYPLALQNPERVEMIVGLEVVPPILSRKAISGFNGKMKTFGLACLYAPKTVKFMLGFAMHKLQQTEDRYSGVHPLIGVVLSEFEDQDGLRVDDLNFQDVMLHKAEGMWRDASYSCVDWAYAQQNSNLRPRAALIHCGNSMIKSPGCLDEFAMQIGAPIHRIRSYLPYVSAALPLVLETLERNLSNR